MNGIRHLSRNDGELAKLIRSYGRLEIPSSNSFFQTLVKAIVHQQLSVSSGRAIFRRLLRVVGGGRITVEGVLKATPRELRKVGLSASKAAYIRELARRFKDGSISSRKLNQSSDAGAIEILTAAPGIGRWTAEIFLIFGLGRGDVLPATDLGLLKAIQRFYRLRSLPSERTLARISEKWRPHRSLACLYLWRGIDGDVTY